MPANLHPVFENIFTDLFGRKWKETITIEPVENENKEEETR